MVSWLEAQQLNVESKQHKTESVSKKVRTGPDTRLFIDQTSIDRVLPPFVTGPGAVLTQQNSTVVHCDHLIQ